MTTRNHNSNYEEFLALLNNYVGYYLALSKSLTTIQSQSLPFTNRRVFNSISRTLGKKIRMKKIEMRK